MNFVQVLVNSLITAAELGIIAIGLTLTLSLLRFANFAHVETAVAGGYLAWVLNVPLGLNFGLSLLCRRGRHGLRRRADRPRSCSASSATPTMWPR